MTTIIGRGIDLSNTYQKDFPAELECACGERMVPVIQIRDDEGHISNMRPEGAGMWPHDSLVLVVYMCQECMETENRWNQA